MQSILQRIADEVAKVSVREVKGPDAELDDGDKIVGTLSDVGIRLFGLRQQRKNLLGSLATRYQHAFIDLQANSRDQKLVDQLNEQVPQILQVQGEHEAINGLLWAQVRSEIPKNAPIGDIGLAKDWRIIVSPPRRRPIGELLEALIGFPV